MRLIRMAIASVATALMVTPLPAAAADVFDLLNNPDPLGAYTQSSAQSQSVSSESMHSGAPLADTTGKGKGKGPDLPDSGMGSVIAVVGMAAAGYYTYRRTQGMKVLAVR